MTCHLHGEPLRVKHANIVDWYDGAAMDALAARANDEHCMQPLACVCMCVCVPCSRMYGVQIAHSLSAPSAFSEAHELLRVAFRSYMAAFRSCPANVDLLLPVRIHKQYTYTHIRIHIHTHTHYNTDTPHKYTHQIFEHRLSYTPYRKPVCIDLMGCRSRAFSSAWPRSRNLTPAR